MINVYDEEKNVYVDFKWGENEHSICPYCIEKKYFNIKRIFIASENAKIFQSFYSNLIIIIHFKSLVLEKTTLIFTIVFRGYKKTMEMNRFEKLYPKKL